jgi:hypothetical protein
MNQDHYAHSRLLGMQDMQDFTQSAAYGQPENNLLAIQRAKTG